MLIGNFLEVCFKVQEYIHINNIIVLKSMFNLSLVPPDDFFAGGTDEFQGARSKSAHKSFIFAI